jgi:hypothetical protein
MRVMAGVIPWYEIARHQSMTLVVKRDWRPTTDQLVLTPCNTTQKCLAAVVAAAMRSRRLEPLCCMDLLELAKQCWQSKSVCASDSMNLRGGCLLIPVVCTHREASNVDAVCISVQMSEILSSYFGETEKYADAFDYERASIT